MSAEATKNSIAPGAWREVALSDDEYARILELLETREPTPVELGMFGSMWSEHCGYKHTRPILVGCRPLPTGFCKAPVRTRARSISAMAWPRYSRSNRTIIRARSSHMKVRPREWAVSSAIFSPWALDPSQS